MRIHARQVAASQACQRDQFTAILHGQVLRHCPTPAQDAHLRPGQRDGAAQTTDHQHRHGRVLLRSAQPMATLQQREHQWPGSPVPAQRHRSDELQLRTT